VRLIALPGPPVRLARSSIRRAAAVGLGSYLLLACSACGATPAGRTAASTPPSPTDVPPNASTAPTAPASCPETVAGTLGGIAGRIYHEAATGGNVDQAVHRLRSSTALAAAVRSGNAAAAASALRSLTLGQIVRVEVLRGGKRLASAGSGVAIAPVTGTIPGSGGGRFVLSVQSEETFLQVTKQVTGAEVLLLDGEHLVSGTIGLSAGVKVPDTGALSVSGRGYQVASIAGGAYPSGRLRIALLVPSAEISCPAVASQTRAAVLGTVGERIYEEELHSPYVAATVHRMQNTAAFRSAVGAHDVAATRAAIIGFFAAHIHVVRVRVTIAGKLLVDVGGPYVLAPVSGTLHSGGRVIGNFQMAIQDDAGYLKLAHLFTGAQVLMRVGSKQVMGTLSPGPASVPDRGTVAYKGHTYQAFSFTGTAFPSGTLRISLLF
jgi:hypothetical protein